MCISCSLICTLWKFVCIHGDLSAHHVNWSYVYSPVYSRLFSSQRFLFKILRFVWVWLNKSVYKNWSLFEIISHYLQRRGLASRLPPRSSPRFSASKHASLRSETLIGSLWSSLDNFCQAWITLVESGSLWSNRDNLGMYWSLGQVWNSLVISGSLWSFLDRLVKSGSHLHIMSSRLHLMEFCSHIM